MKTTSFVRVTSDMNISVGAPLSAESVATAIQRGRVETGAPIGSPAYEFD